MQTTEKLSITIPTRYANLVRGSVESGSYASNSEVIREALRVWEDFHEVRQKRIAALKAEIDEAYNETEPPLSADEVFDDLENGL